MIAGCIAVWILAQASQPPVPSRGEQSQAQQNQTKTNPNAAGKQAPVPSPAITNISVVVPEQPSPNQAGSNQNRNPGENWWSIGASIAVAVFTAILVGFTLLQLRFNWRMEAHTKTVERPSARRFVPNKVPDNLVFVTESGYNYDIEIDEHGNPKNETRPKKTQSA